MTIVSAAVVAVIGVLVMWRWSADTPGMAAMKRTGMVGYTPTGATLGFYAETQAGTNLLGDHLEDGVRWSVVPPQGGSTLDLLRAIDRAARAMGFDARVTPIGKNEHPLGDPEVPVYWFQRYRRLPGILIGISAQTNPAGTVDVSIWVDPAYYR